MIETQTLYPLCFEPVYIEKIWAGNLLPDLAPGVGEVWSIVDRENQQSFIKNGPLAGMTLMDLIYKDPEAIFGIGQSEKPFPVLVKLINAGDRLSVQVHPGKDGPAGSESKSEMWYVLDAQDHAEIYAGFKENYSKSEIERSLIDGVIIEKLNVYSPKSGDSYFIPPGTVHALGAGNLVLEIQQNSDSTYRLFDWNRKDHQGNSRTLHLEEGIDAIKPVRYKMGVNWEIEQPSFSLKEIIDTEWATVYEISGDYMLNCRRESCFIISAVEKTTVQFDEISFALGVGESTLIPAVLDGVKIEGVKWLLTKVK